MKPQAQGRKEAGHWHFFAPVALVCLALMLLPNGARDALSFDRAAILSGEFWRLVGGHFVHLGVAHGLLNVGGLVLVALLCGSALTLRQWLVVLLVCLAGTSLGLWFGLPQLQNYVGLSGVLHGLLVAGLLSALSGNARIESIVLLIIIAAKLVYEQLSGPLPGSSATVGGAVIVEAHLYGAISGLASGAIVVVSRRFRAG